MAALVCFFIHKGGGLFFYTTLTNYPVGFSLIDNASGFLIPAVTHVDGTARVQTINKNTNAKLWSLVKEFENITGIPVLINTSFNLKGEPIVCSPEDAIGCFKKSQMDCLVLGNYVVERV